MSCTEQESYLIFGVRSRTVSKHMFCQAWSSLLDSVVRSAKRLCESKLRYLGHRSKLRTLCLLY